MPQNTGNPYIEGSDVPFTSVPHDYYGEPSGSNEAYDSIGIAFATTAAAPALVYGISDFAAVPEVVEGVDVVVSVDEGVEAFEAVQVAVELAEGVDMLTYLGIFV